jgi:hypothetical protein
MLVIKRKAPFSGLCPHWWLTMLLMRLLTPRMTKMMNESRNERSTGTIIADAIRAVAKRMKEKKKETMNEKIGVRVMRMVRVVMKMEMAETKEMKRVLAGARSIRIMMVSVTKIGNGRRARRRIIKIEIRTVVEMAATRIVKEVIDITGQVDGIKAKMVMMRGGIDSQDVTSEVWRRRIRCNCEEYVVRSYIHSKSYKVSEHETASVAHPLSSFLQSLKIFLADARPARGRARFRTAQVQ